MKRKVIRLAAFTAMLLLFMFAVQGIAQEGNVRLGAQVGYDGTILCGAWYPLSIEIQNMGDAISGEIRVPLARRQQQVDELIVPVEIAAGETKQLRIPITTEIPQMSFKVSLSAGGETIAQATAEAIRSAEDSAMIIGMLGGSEALSSALCVATSNDEMSREEIVRGIALDAASFPQTGEEMNAFHVLMIDGFDESALTSEQQALFSEWVRDGGVVIRSQTDTQKTVDEAVPQEENVASMLLALCGAASKEEMMPVPIYPMDINGTQRVLIENELGALLVCQDMGKGFILTCGFSLSSPQMVEAAQQNLWRLVLLEIDPEAYNSCFYSKSNGNVETTMSLSQTKVSRGVSILPVAVLLTGYTLIAGVGLYVALRRMDRSRLLWAAIPAAALAAFGFVVYFAAGLGLNQPAAVSQHVSVYRADGDVQAYEQVYLGYAQQERVRISTENGEEIERLRYSYFSSWGAMDEQTELRDRVTLGDAPSVELPAKAPWVTRDLIIKTDRTPLGAIDASAWMAEDGLHARIVNATEHELTDAVLLTDIGYADIGVLSPGEEKDVSIARPQSYSYRNGEALILPAQMTPYRVGLYQTARASVYPEEQAEIGFVHSSLGEQELYVRNQKYNAISTAISFVGSENALRSVLFARCEGVECALLLFNGSPITRQETSSIVACEVDVQSVSQEGYFYYPAGTFAVRSAELDETGTPDLLEIAADDERGESDVYYGICLDGVDREQIREIRIHPQGSISENVIPEVYDHLKKEWVCVQGIVYGLIPDSLVESLVSEEGELFMRFTAEALGNSYAYVPEIIVEGGAKK